MRRLIWIGAVLCGLWGCDGGDGSTTPDESGDLGGGGGGGGERVAADVPMGLDGTQWRWLEAHCTEGPLDLASRGYAANLFVTQDQTSGATTLITDQEFANESCQHTIAMRATPPESGENWTMQEVARVALPATDECYDHPEDTRPGTVRRQGQLLEVLVQRANWCNGYELRMVYAPRDPQPRTENEIVRHYAVLFTLGNADAIAEMFAEAGTLLEPFTRTDTGVPYRHEGRPAVREWYGETFNTAPWRAMRITEIAEGQTASGAASRTVTWEYMDPRLSEPLPGTTEFTIAAGEIYEAEISLSGEPNLRPEEGEGEDGEDGEGEEAEGEEAEG